MYGKTRAGVGLPVLVGPEGEPIMMAAGGLYADAGINGRLFYAANQTPVQTSTTLNTNFTGLAINNPAGSGKLLVMHEFGYALDQACASEMVLALATTDDTTFAADITIRCTRDGYAASVAIADAAVNPMIAPIIVKIIASLGQGADSTQFMPPPTIITLGGSIVLAPGRSVVTDATVASGATSIQFSFMWEEVDE